MRVGSLFSGIGGIELGFEREGFKTSWLVERDPYCQAILKKHFPGARIYGDIEKIEFKRLPTVDVLTGGFPCQPHSTAGKRKASKDERDLWPQFHRAIREVRPKVVVAENVVGIFSSEHGRFLKGILSDLAQVGYDAQWRTISAAEVGAIHRRERVFIIANDNRDGYDALECAPKVREGQPCPTPRRAALRGATADTSSVGAPQEPQPERKARILADNWGERVQGFRSETLSGKSGLSWCKDVRSIEDIRGGPSIPQPLVRRGDDGFSTRLDRFKQESRIRALGNAVVPQVAQFIARQVKEMMT